MKAKRAPRFRLEPERMFSVYDGRTCIGFLLSRGEHEVEAFDAGNKLLGRFSSLKRAAAAVTTTFQNMGAENGGT